MRKIENISRMDIRDSDAQVVRLTDGRVKSWRSVCIIAEPAIQLAGTTVEYCEASQPAVAMASLQPEQGSVPEA